MKALIVGYGSIGQRHADVVAAMGHDVAIVSRRANNGLPLFNDLNQALADWSPDYVIVASRTHEHGPDLETLAKSGFRGTVLVEKPLFGDVHDIGPNSFRHLFVGYNLRFHPVLLEFRRVLGDLEIYAVHTYVGQFLPDWRPGTDYRSGASASRASCGGVLRDLSHELDYLIWLLGDWIELTAVGGHCSNLEIDSDDVFSVLMRTERCPVVSVHMNYLDRVTRREIIAHTNKGTISADLVAGSADWFGRADLYEIDRNHTYRREHEAALSGDESILCSYSEGLRIVSTIRACEDAAAASVWVRN